MPVVLSKSPPSTKLLVKYRIGLRQGEKVYLVQCPDCHCQTEIPREYRGMIEQIMSDQPLLQMAEAM